MKWDTGSYGGLNWDFASSAGKKWDVTSPTDIKWDGDSPAGMKWNLNSPNGMKWDVNSATPEIKWDVTSPTDMKWDTNSYGGMNWDLASSAGMKWDVTSPTEIKLEGNLPKVSISCLTKAKDLTAPTTLVTCPEKCLTQKSQVWGNDTYADESSICQAAIHAGAIPKEGGSAIVVKRSGEKVYKDSTRNGVKSKSRGPSTGSFVFGSMPEFQFSTSNIDKSDPISKKSDKAQASKSPLGFFSRWG
ncbi:vitrin-like [Ranitomeya variabilis]|uniref:vitrin-like n=1 Tax=Ranitomeya variabilis TaxID=490064 RepID=UPI0040574F8C